jgi:hypothetical protein
MSRRRVILPMLLLAAGVLAGCGSSSSSSSTAASSAVASASASSNSTSTAMTAPSSTASTTAGGQTPGPEGIPLEPGPELAPASSTTQGATVDGIQCAPVEQLVYHIHSHVQVYVNGEPRSLPAAIGLIGPVAQDTPYGKFYGAQTCYYWLHTHTNDGVIHVESPSKRIYTLGNFFDEWRQPLSPTQVAGAKGKVTAFLNGKPWTKNPRTIPLIPHASIDLDVGTPVVPPKVISWAGTSL